MTEFPCSGCGACCKRVDKSLAAIKNQNPGISIKEIFPHKVDESGRCEMLLPDNSCKVYDSRPFICSVDNLQGISGMDKQEFYNLTIKECNKLMDETDVDHKFRI